MPSSATATGPAVDAVGVVLAALYGGKTGSEGQPTLGDLSNYANNSS